MRCPYVSTYEYSRAKQRCLKFSEHIKLRDLKLNGEKAERLGHHEHVKVKYLQYHLKKNFWDQHVGAMTSYSL